MVLPVGHKRQMDEAESHAHQLSTVTGAAWQFDEWAAGSPPSRGRRTFGRSTVRAKLRGAKLASRKPRRSRGGANPASSLECAAGSPPSRGRKSLGHSTATRSTGTRSSVALASVVPAEAGTQRRCGAAIDSPSPTYRAQCAASLQRARESSRRGRVPRRRCTPACSGSDR
jgi:hypothetical protein